MMTRGCWQDVSVCKVLAAKMSDLNWSLGLKWWKEEMGSPSSFFDLKLSSLACVHAHAPRQIINVSKELLVVEMEIWGMEPVECSLSQEIFAESAALRTHFPPADSESNLVAVHKVANSVRRHPASGSGQHQCSALPNEGRGRQEVFWKCARVRC